MHRRMIAFVLAFCLITNTLQLYCSSTCADYTQACFDDTPYGCWVCAFHIFNLNANLTSTTPCSLLSQTSIIAN
jgi:hypothetical protein